MDIVKKNMVSILCGAVALLAIMAWFWPLGGMFGDLKLAADSRISVYNEVDRLLHSPRRQPVISLDNSEALTLDVFPNQQVIDAGGEITGWVQQQSIGLLNTAVKLNRDEMQILSDNGLQDLIVPGVLPTPGILGFQYRSDYRRYMTLDIPNKILKAGVPPSAELVKTRAELEWKDKFAPRLIYVDNKAVNEDSIKNEFNDYVKDLPDLMRSDVAQTSKMYMNADALTIDRVLADERASAQPDSLEVWWAQVGAWIQTDLARALATANAKSAGVQDAVVKRLLKIDVPTTGFFGAVLMATESPGAAAMAAPPVVDPNQPLPRNLTVSLTGRVSNSLYDVIHTKLVVDVDAKQLPTLLQELSRNRLVTVLKVDIASLDSATTQAAGFVYGPAPVVQATLQCEVLLMRQWTTQYMPGRLKRSLGIIEPVVAPVP